MLLLPDVHHNIYGYDHLLCIGCSTSTTDNLKRDLFKRFVFLSGNPKGAMLTHENVVSDAAGVLRTFEVHVIKWCSTEMNPYTIFSTCSMNLM